MVSKSFGKLKDLLTAALYREEMCGEVGSETTDCTQ
jgi:hypothetical protein